MASTAKVGQTARQKARERRVALEAETKARNELESAEVVAKTRAGSLWCSHAAQHARSAGVKPWKFLLIPHEQVTEDKSLPDFLHFEQRPPRPEAP